MVKSGELERVQRGVYCLADAWEDEFLVAQLRFPKGVFSDGTALYSRWSRSWKAASGSTFLGNAVNLCLASIAARRQPPRPEGGDLVIALQLTVVLAPTALQLLWLRRLVGLAEVARSCG